MSMALLIKKVSHSRDTVILLTMPVNLIVLDGLGIEQLRRDTAVVPTHELPVHVPIHVAPHTERVTIHYERNRTNQVKHFNLHKERDPWVPRLSLLGRVAIVTHVRKLELELHAGAVATLAGLDHLRVQLLALLDGRHGHLVTETHRERQSLDQPLHDEHDNGHLCYLVRA
jgi:hypothetical protein